MTYYTHKVITEYSPIAYLPINEHSGETVVDDYTGHGYTGSPSNVLLGDVTSPDNSLAATFEEASSSEIDLLPGGTGYDSAVDPTECTVVLWIKVPFATWADGKTHVFSRHDADASNNIILLRQTGGGLSWFYRAGGTTKEVSTTAYNPTDWFMMTLTISATDDEVKGYYNDVLVDTQTGLGAWAGAIITAAVGSNGRGGSYVEADLAHHIVFDRAITADEVADLYVTTASSSVVVSHIPHELYTIKVFDHDGVLKQHLQKWNRLEFHQRLNSPWNHQITLEFGYDDPDLTTIRSFERDWIIEVHRLDPVTLISSKVYEGFHTTMVDQVRAQGGIIINLYGVGYTQLLQRRLALPTSGQEYSTKSGAAETVIKGFVSENAIAPADTNRTITGLSISADHLSGNYVSYAARYTNLFSVCETVSEQGNLDFGIYGGSSVGKFIFEAKTLWGEDFREGNPEGNIPILFGINRDNMLVPILSKNSSAEQNYAYVGGDGQGANRTIQEVYDSAAIAQSPWGRKEVFVEARQQTDTTALVATGKMELQNRKAQASLSFDVKQTEQSRWLRDWNLGDLITAQYYTYYFDKQIVEIGVVVSPGGQQYEAVTVEFEDLRII